MHRLKLRSHVGADGILTLQVPSGVQDVDVEVEVTVTPLLKDSDDIALAGGWQPGFFDNLAGSWEGEPLVRPESLPLEIRDGL